MTTSAANSEETKKVYDLHGYDTVNGLRIVGEWAGGTLDPYTIVNPVTVGASRAKDAAEDDNKVTVSATPILFAQGTLYKLNEQNVVAHYRCVDPMIHEVYAKTLAPKEDVTNAGTDVSGT